MRYIENLVAEVNVPSDGILSRTLHNDDRLRVVLFGFAPGQELTEHTSKMPAVLQLLEGDAHLKLGTDEFDAGAGAWAYMPPELPHSVLAKSRVVMLLLMLKGGTH
jgi:quercetin dioxygenase-like cupin family protein